MTAMRSGPGFAATEKATASPPWPVAPEVIRIQSTALLATTAQLAGACTSKRPAPPLAANSCRSGDARDEQAPSRPAAFDGATRTGPAEARSTATRRTVQPGPTQPASATASKRYRDTGELRRWARWGLA